MLPLVAFNTLYVACQTRVPVADVANIFIHIFLPCRHLGCGANSPPLVVFTLLLLRLLIGGFYLKRKKLSITCFCHQSTTNFSIGNTPAWNILQLKKGFVTFLHEPGLNTDAAHIPTRMTNRKRTDAQTSPGQMGQCSH